MGPLVPLLFLVPIFAIFAWLLIDKVVIKGIPVFSVLFFIGIFWIIFGYYSHYSAFAKNDPDRLQSEQYRSEMQQLQVIAKGWDGPLPDNLLDAPIPNPAALEYDTDNGSSHPIDPREEDHS